MKLKILIFVVILAGNCLLSASAVAAPRGSAVYAEYGDVQAPEAISARIFASSGVSLDEAAAQVRRQTGGRIIKANSRTSNGRTVHYIRVLSSDGRVFTVRVDAASGRRL